jgi:exosortase
MPSTLDNPVDSSIGTDALGVVRADAAIDSPKSRVGLSSIVAAIAALGGVVWLYWPDLLTMQAKWETDPQYSHGYLVPIIAGFLLWTRRDSFDASNWNASSWGIVLLATGLGLKIVSSYYYIESLGHLSMIVVLTAVVASVWGRKGIRWAWPGMLFLVFMLPLPHSLENALQAPLRSIGTISSTFLLQTLGLPAFREGYIISIGEQSIGVAEACSGIRMLMVFFALSTAVALIIEDSWPVRLGLIFSAIPIAILANVLRIASTGAMYHYFADSTVFGMPGTEFAGKFFHDWAGWFMIPVALLLLWLELWLLDRLVIKVADRPLIANLDAGMPAARKRQPSPQGSDIQV